MRLAGRSFGLWLALGLLATLATAATPEQEIEFATRDAERYFERSGLLVDDPDAAAYLQGVLRRVVEAAPDAALADCRIFLIRGVHANGFALPNCRVYLSTALFMTLENEEQLAAVISRELTHVQWHSVLNNRRVLTEGTNFANFFSAALAGYSGVNSPGVAANMTDAVGDLVWRVSVRGFTDEIELRVDGGAQRRLTAAGYKSADAIRALERLRSAAPAPPNKKADSLPLLANREVLDSRLKGLRRSSGGNSDGATLASEAHARLASQLRIGQIGILITGGDLTLARSMLAEQVAAGGANGVTYHLAAGLERRSGAAREVVLANYEKGAAFADAPSQLFLHQGMMLHEQGDEERSRQAFRRFLELEPTSPDAALVRYYLEKPLKTE